MTKRIFRSHLALALTVLLAALALILGALYNYFSAIQQRQLAMQTQLAAQGVAKLGMAYFDGLDVRDYRLSWIDADGTVLYDSAVDAAAIENHLQRPEVRQALEDGLGQDRRLSATMMERYLYTAQALPDGTVLRLSIAQSSLLAMVLGAGQALSVVLLLALGLLLLAVSWAASTGIYKRKEF